MVDADKPRFVEILVGLSDYYDRELSETMIAIYWVGLKAYDLKAVERALFNHTKSPELSGRFMPKVADIIQMMEGNSADSAYLAWSKVDQAVKQIGAYSDLAFDDWIIHRVVADMGGWPLLCSKQSGDWPFIAKEFENRYRGYHIKRDIQPYPAVVIGIAGAHNRGGNFALAPPMLIGDREKAQAILAGGSTKPLIGMAPLSEIVKLENHEK